MTENRPDFIFECRKCGHNVYVQKNEVHKLLDYECPECGEEAGGLWILLDEGDFDNR